MFIAFESTRLPKRFAHLLLCTALAVGLMGCGGAGRTTPSPSASPEPTYLTEEILCDAVSNDLLKDQLSLKVRFYHFQHSSDVDQNGLTVNYFECRLYGDQSSPQGTFGLLISYNPYEQLELSHTEFSSLDEKGLDETTFDGIDGRGYVWVGEGGTLLEAAWLYPDNQALEITLFHINSNDRIYSEDDLERLREVLKELITTIPPVAAGPAQRPLMVPPNPNKKDKQLDNRQGTSTP